MFEMKNCLIFLCLFSFCCSILGNSLKVYDPDVAECTKSGLMCETCSTSVMCIQMGNKYIKTSRINCADDSSCFNGTCTKAVNPACDYVNLDFPCQYQGVYPDPGDWSKFVFCVPNDDGVTFQAIKLNCESGTGYNSLTTYCSKNLTNIAVATFPIDRCIEPSQTPIPLKGNPSIYYICAPYGDTGKLYPFQAACPSGGIFADGACTINLT